MEAQISSGYPTNVSIAGLGRGLECCSQECRNRVQPTQDNKASAKNVDFVLMSCSQDEVEQMLQRLLL